MGVVEQTSGAVESQLSVLEQSYGSFPINQRTIAVPTAEYEKQRERSATEQVELYVKVVNEQSELLHTNRDGRHVLPSVATTVDSELEQTARETISEQTGLSIAVEEIESVTILGVRDGDDEQRETVYTLAVLFEAHPESGPIEGAVWEPYEPGTHPVFD